jgi:hypothetical protein
VLFETMGFRSKYACLSHCWGESQPLRTTTANLESHYKRIPWANCPKTFQQSMDVASFLGLDFLWIDSLCIIQDDKEDWEREASRMADVYGRSHLTIAAAASPRSDHGLFAEIPSSFVGRSVPVVGGHDRSLRMHYIAVHETYDDHWNREANGVTDKNRYSPISPASDYPLTSRSWTLQEHFLSLRIAMFGPCEVALQCATRDFCCCNEKHTNTAFLEKQRVSWLFMADLPQSMLDGHPTHKQMDEAAYNRKLRQARNDVWWSLVSAYTGKLITKESDRLPALSGLAKALRSCLETEYLAGLWADRLALDLCWQTSDCNRSREAAEFRAPSWSWASLEGRVKNNQLRNHETVCDVGILNLQHTYDRTGVVLMPGKLAILGRAIISPRFTWQTPATQVMPLATKSNRPTHFLLALADGIFLEFFPDVAPQGPSYRSIQVGQRLRCLCIAWNKDPPSGPAGAPLAEFLVLVPHPAQEEASEYVRVGYAFLRAGLIEKMGQLRRLLDENTSPERHLIC